MEIYTKTPRLEKVQKVGAQSPIVTYMVETSENGMAFKVVTILPKDDVQLSQVQFATWKSSQEHLQRMSKRSEEAY